MPSNLKGFPESQKKHKESIMLTLIVHALVSALETCEDILFWGVLILIIAYYIRALIISYTIFGIPYYNYRIMDPHTLL